MEVKEFCKMAIQMIISGNDIPLLPETKGYFERIIALLQQGEKYWQMWEEFKSHWGTYNFNESLGLISVKGITNDLEQKYFPKEEKENEESKITR